MSSRRSLPSKVPDHTVTCGWDNPLQTFFCTVARERGAGEREADDPVVLWLGLDEREVRTAEALVAPLAPYAELDAATLSLLRADRAADLDRGRPCCSADRSSRSAGDGLEDQRRAQQGHARTS